MTLEEALRDLGGALADAQGCGGGDARMRTARRVLADRCGVLLGLEGPGRPSVAEMIRLARGVPGREARRGCAVLVLHALAVRGVVPMACAGDVCALADGALHNVLLRCGYPFGGGTEEKMRVLERLHPVLGELMQPLEPTFPPSIQGLYAG